MLAYQADFKSNKKASSHKKTAMLIVRVHWSWILHVGSGYYRGDFQFWQRYPML